MVLHITRASRSTSDNTENGHISNRSDQISKMNLSLSMFSLWNSEPPYRPIPGVANRTQSNFISIEHNGTQSFD